MADTLTIWDDLIKLRDNTKDDTTRNRCNMYLRQINTAAGSKVKIEAVNWINNLKN